MNFKIEKLSEEDLIELDDEQIIKFLHTEYEKVYENLTIKDVDVKEMLRDNRTLVYEILHLLRLASIPDSISEHAVVGGTEHFINLRDLLRRNRKISDAEFSQFLKALYIIDYIGYHQRYIFNETTQERFNHYVNDGDLRLDPMLRWRYNLNWLYSNRKSLFKQFSQGKSAEEIYYFILTMGSTVDMLENSYLNITDKGLHYLNAISNEEVQNISKESHDLVHKLKKELGIQKSKNELLDKKMKHQNNIVSTQEKRLNEFYQHIITILGLLLAAFSFIGLNISAIPKIEGNFAINILVLNLSLILVLVVVFGLLKVVVFESDTELHLKRVRPWLISIVSIFLLLMGVTAFFSPNVEKSGLVKFKDDLKKQQESYEDSLKEAEKEQKLYEDRLEETQKELLKATLNLESLNKEITRLENIQKLDTE
ncbi:hypothetical protein [Priestia megaterium]|uniref:hypothetical protein n=1 Tax=Priestia megaterium TaxID=1404 RepID=UPI00196ACD6F|nr:hypothetical protein [Priestia megaterium]QSF42268.1 hypothetical protein ICR96_30220 [Priestia megaterium]